MEMFEQSFGIVGHFLRPATKGTLEQCLALIYKYRFSLRCIPILTYTILGYIIVCVSFALKLPQIYKITRKKSSAGISESSTYLEVLYFSLMVGYSYNMGHSFHAYGENVIAAGQCFLQCILIWHYMGVTYTKIVREVVIVLVIFGSILFTDLIPISLWTLMPIASIFLHIAVKVPQIRVNWLNQSTGQLSLPTTLLYTLGSGLRVYTWFLQNSDWPLLLNFTVATGLNVTLCLQFARYWKNELTTKKVN